jgi:UDP-N-acetylmuramate dehydrogenase
MNIQKSISLLPFNTFHIDVAAKYFAEIKTETDFEELLSDEKFRSQQKLILGGGSNILFTKNFDGIVVKNSFNGISIVKEDENFVWVRAAAGEVWHQFVLWCIEKNLAGLENLSLIPVLGMLSCLYMMAQIELKNWIGFTIWLFVGLIIYFSFSYKNSKLNLKKS